MSHTAVTIQASQSRALPAIFWGGLIAGALDITYACTFSTIRGGSPERVLQSVASGLLGPASFQMGWTSAALGLPLHFLIAFGAATTYYLASRKLTFLTKRAPFWGVTFGLAIYFFMQWVVLPLSAAPKFKTSTASVAFGIPVHMFFIGLPIALSVRKFSK